LFPRWLIAALILLCAIAAISIAAPRAALTLLGGLANLWELALLATTLLTILWFIYSIWLRRVLRARRIAAIHMRRLMREAAEQDTPKASEAERER
jgi:hypothetical protein